VNRSACRSCRRLVYWARSAASGKPMPLDLDGERGNVLVDASGKSHVFRNHAQAVATAQLDASNGAPVGFDSDTYISHHADGQCPKGREWQGKRRSDPDAPDPQGSLL
jgi:hypothetical protein